MTKLKDGGPVYPVPIHYNECTCPCGGVGITVRQWYAGKVLQGELASNTQGYEWSNKDNLAKFCFEQADAMIKFEEMEK